MLRRLGHLGAIAALALVASSSGPLDSGSSASPPAAPVEERAAPQLPVLAPVPSTGIHVRVTLDGAAAADAEVTISDGSRAVLATAKTDAGGLARFADLPAGPYELWATHDAQVSPVARVELTTDAAADVELALGPGAVLHGELIVNGADSAIPEGASAELVPLDVDHAVRTIAIDATGQFVISGVPAGQWRLEAHAAGYVQTEPALIIARNAELSATVHLVAAGSVSGHVVDEAGKPIANATLMLRDSAGTPLWPFGLGSNGTRWVHPLARVRFLPTIPDARFGAGRWGSRPAECGRGHCGVDLGYERGDIVHAVADGVVSALFPVPNTEAGKVVVIQHPGGLRSMYMHLDDIRPGLDVGQRIHAGDPVGTLGMTGILHSAAHLHFAITQQYAGRTWYVDPEPMLRSAVVLPQPRAFDLATGACATATDAPTGDTTAATARFTTDATGGFTIDGVPPGSYVAVAFAPELATGTSDAIVVKSGEPSADTLITLRPGALVQGRVVGPNGAIAGARVNATAGIGESVAKIATTTTDRNGEYSLRALSGKLTLTVDADGYSDGMRTITVEDGDSRRARAPENFTLAIENAQLRGQLLAAEGGPAAGVSVRIVGGISRRTTVTDAQGRFDLSPVAGGRYVLELTSRDHPAKQVSLDSGRWLEVRLDRGGEAQVQVRAVGVPGAGIVVTARGPSGQRIERPTDGRGALDLHALAPGSWTFSARAPGLTLASKTQAVRADAPARIELELSRAVTLAGVVRDRFGRRVAGAKLTLAGLTATTAEDGSFRIAEAPAGALTLQAEHDDMQGAIDLEVRPGDERLSLELELR